MPETTTANNKFKLEMTIPGVDERHLPTDTFLLVSVALMAIYFVVVVYYIVPKFQQTLTSYRDLQAKSKELEHYQERQEDIERILHDERYNDSMVSLVDRILYNYNPYTEVLLSIDQLAQKHRLTVSGLEYSPGLVATPSAQVASSEESYPITFNVSGSYREITAFLLNLEKQAPFNSVSSARITNNYNDGSATAQVEVLAQYHLPKVLVSVETDLSPIGADEEKTLATLQEFQLNDYNLGHPTSLKKSKKLICSLLKIMVWSLMKTKINSAS